MKRFGPAGVTILGFKPLEALKPWQNIKSAYFMFPDEALYKGSTKAFLALCFSMCERKVFALATMIGRKNEPPKLVALLPQKECYDDEREEVGLDVVYILSVYTPYSINLLINQSTNTISINLSTLYQSIYQHYIFQSTNTILINLPTLYQSIYQHYINQSTNTISINLPTLTIHR